MISQTLHNRIKKYIETNLPFHPSRKHHFSFIVQGKNKIIAVGVNFMNKTNPHSPHPHYTIHSELDALLKLDIPLHKIYGKDYWIINVRVMKNGKWGLSKPCKYCQNFLKATGFINIIYSTKNGNMKWL